MDPSAGTLDPLQLATILTLLSDETIDNMSLEKLQKKLQSSFNTNDHIKVCKANYSTFRAFLVENSSFYIF